MSDLRDALAKLVENKQNAITVYPARLGDGSGRVIAGAGLVYVRVADMVTIAACASVPPIHDLNVWIGYDPIQPNILRVISQRDVTGKQEFAPGVSAHAAMHEFMGAGSLGGTDVVKVQLQQFMPLAVWPYQGLKVIIYPGVVWVGNQYKLVADINAYDKPVPKIINFAEYPAPDADKEMYYLIGIDNTGSIQVIAGNQVNLGAITLADIPSPPASMVYTLAAVRRMQDQAAITINRESADIVDLRFPLAHKHTEADLPNNALKIGGYPVDVSGITVGSALIFNGEKFAPGDVSGGGGIHWYVDGHLEASGVIVRSYVAPRDMTIRKVFMMLEQLGTSGTTTIDIHKNGTTIFTNPSNRPSLVYNASTTVVSVVPEITAVAEGDILTLYIVAAADGGEGLNVVIDTSSDGTGNVSGGFDVGIDSLQHWPSSQYNEEFNNALSSEWIALNMGSNTYEVKNSALVMKLVGTSGLASCGVVKPIPSGYWKCYAKIGMSAMSKGSVSDWTATGIMLYDQNSGRLGALVNNRSYANNTINLNFELWSNFTTWNSNPTSQERMQYYHPYLYVAKKSTGWDFGFSCDGAEFCYMLTDYNLTYLTPTHIGLFANAVIGSSNSVHTMHWMRFEII